MDIPFLVKLEGFKHLSKGWAYGEGGPIDARVINDATQIIYSALSYGLDKMDVFPGLAGEVAVSLYDDGQHLEFIVETDGAVTFAHEIGGQEIDYKEGLSLDEALSMLQNYGKKEKRCAISEYSTSNTMIQPSDGSLAWRSDPREMVVAYRFLVKHVQKQRVVRSASTSPIFTLKFPDLRLCTGS